MGAEDRRGEEDGDEVVLVVVQLRGGQGQVGVPDTTPAWNRDRAWSLVGGCSDDDNDDDNNREWQ